MAGHRGLDGKLRLLAWGIITGVNNGGWDHDISTGTGQTITAACTAVEFTLVGINYIPYENHNAKAPKGFHITAPAAWQQIPGTSSLAASAHRLTIDGSLRQISYYPLPAQALGDSDPFIIDGQSYWSLDTNGNDTWYDNNESADRGHTATGGIWSITSNPTSRPNGAVNSPDSGDVISAEFHIEGLPDKAEDVGNLFYFVTGPGGAFSLELNTIPVDIGSDPGIPMMASTAIIFGPLSGLTQGTTDTVTGSFTGDIHTAETVFPVTLKTYPLPYGKSGGWALLNAKIYVKALSEDSLKTWVIETGADLYGLDEAMPLESTGGSILFGIGNPASTSTGGMTISPGNP